jgi:hypothetical protein|tara:strand:- start:370 stop:576 length:207 start_codon:yes stop_codon:yes gene_type:complete
VGRSTRRELSQRKPYKGSRYEYDRGKKMIYYDGQEWRDPEELLHMAGMESGEKYEEAAAFLAREGYDL